jgi:hypothetical protein
MSTAETPGDDATIAAVVGRALVDQVSRLERSNAQLRARADAITTQRDVLAVELQRLDRLADVAREAASRLRPMSRGVAEGTVPAEDLAAAIAGVRALIGELAPQADLTDHPRRVHDAARLQIEAALARARAAADQIPSRQDPEEPCSDLT